MTDLDALTERLIARWADWDHQPGDPILVRRCTAALVAFQPLLEPLGLSWLDLVRAIQAHRRGAPSFPGRPGHGAAVADAVQSSVNALVPPHLHVVAAGDQQEPQEGHSMKEAS